MEIMEDSGAVKKYIEEIRDQIKENNMSFIVGAGFSKNLSAKFPLWDELLLDMIIELYPECNEHMDDDEKKKAVQQLIHEKGYLEIASEYVERKGYHEAIDIYIEEHIPYLKKKENNFVVMKNGIIEDDKPDLSCHQKLLRLGVKNIYTFNYDNSLDLLAGSAEAVHFLEQEQDEQKKLAELESIQRDYEKLKNKWVCCVAKSDVSNGITSALETKKNIDEEFHSLENRLNLLNIVDPINESTDSRFQGFEKCLQNNISIVKGKINDLKARRMDNYYPVTNDYEISLTNNCKSIFKLHGNLRIDEKEEYGFDNDRCLQYIISKEDYEKYQIRHEAFVNLMRIALLKGAFCLLGFSGDDPNFVAWIRWVKDILDKGHSSANGGPKSIFYINVDDCSRDKGKLQLMSNNYIQPVDLYKAYPDINAIADEKLRRKKRLSAFLDDICSSDCSYNSVVGKYELESSKLCSRILKSKEPKPFKDDIEELYELSEVYRFPKCDVISSNKRHRYLRLIFELLSSASRKKMSSSDKTVLLKLIFVAIKGSLMPIDRYLEKMPSFKEVKDDKLKSQYHSLYLHVKALKGGPIVRVRNSNDSYEKILSSFLNLDFKHAKDFIKNWKPSDGWDQLRKLLFGYILEDETNKTDFEKLLDPCSYKSMQDYSIGVDILYQLSGACWDMKEDYDLLENIQSKHDNLNKSEFSWMRFDGIQSILIADNKKIERISPYGNAPQRIQIGKKEEVDENALRLLQFYLEIGLVPKLHNYIFLNQEDWDRIYPSLFEYYPYPCFFFTLMYGNDKDLIRRVSQSYIFSPKLQDICTKLLENMMGALLQKETPDEIRYAIYIAAPIFMQLVPPHVWSDSFIKIFNDKGIKHPGSVHDFTNLPEFIRRGLELCSVIEFKQEVIEKILSKSENIDFKDNDMIISAIAGLGSLSDKNMESLKRIVDTCTTKPQIYVLLNLRSFLDKLDKVKLVKKLMLSNTLKLSEDTSLLHGLCRLASEVHMKEFNRYLIPWVLENKDLWQDNIGKDGKVLYANEVLLEINEITKIIRFEKEEILYIYEQLKYHLQQMRLLKIESEGLFSFFTNWIDLLCMMKYFLSANKRLLGKEKAYQTVSQQVEDLLNKRCGGKTLIQMLFHEEFIDRALTCLVYATEYGKFNETLLEAYLILVQRIIVHSTTQLDSCIRHFAWALSKKFINFPQNRFISPVGYLLKVYQNYFLPHDALVWDIQYAQKNVVERALLKIYKKYRDWGVQIEFWEKYIPEYYPRDNEN